MVEYPGALTQSIWNFIASFGEMNYFICAILLFLVFGFLVGKSVFLGVSKKWNFVFPVLLIMLFAWGRFPSFALPEANPDESYWMILGAQLSEVFLPYITNDSGTGGPFVPGLLALLPALGAALNYANVRFLLLVICILPTILFLYFGLKRRVGSAAAMTGTLIPAALFAFPDYCWDFIAYNSEFVSLPVLSLVFYLHCRFPIDSKWVKITQGFILFSILWIKVQVLPIAFIMGLIVLFDSTERTTGLISKHHLRRLGWLSLGTFSGLFLLFLYFIIHPEAFNNYWISAYQANFSYVQKGLSGGALAGWDRILVIPRIIENSGAKILTACFYIHIALFLSVGIVALIKKKIPPGGLVWSLILFVFVCISISIPGNRFYHYLILLLPATTIVVAEIYSYFETQNFRILKISLPVVGLVFFGWHLGRTTFHRLTDNHLAYAGVVYYQDKELSDFIKAQTKPEEKIAVWGWMNNLYMESERLPEIEPETYRAIFPSSLQKHYFQKYVEAIKAKPPVLYIDVVAPGSFQLNIPDTQGLQCFEEVNSFIQSNYQLITVINGKSVYRRINKL
jgi:hypothetical protein